MTARMGRSSLAAEDSSGLQRVRRLGKLVETIHAVVYFAPEPLTAYADLGLRGYWRGYFASRAAPLGAVSAEVVTALFAGFAPSMVARAVPAVWEIATPQQVRAARLAGATAALHRLLEHHDPSSVAHSTALTRQCVDNLPLPGRPMAAAQLALGRPAEPLAALWHDCTVLREYRGDAHLVAVSAAQLTWPEPHLMQGLNVDRRQREYRGWDEETWQAAAQRVRDRDLTQVDALTDQLAASSYAGLSPAELGRLEQVLAPLARSASTALPYPNAMGLPPL